MSAEKNRLLVAMILLFAGIWLIVMAISSSGKKEKSILPPSVFQHDQVVRAGKVVPPKAASRKILPSSRTITRPMPVSVHTRPDAGKVAGSWVEIGARNEDHAGIWGQFYSGFGNINRDPADWNWIVHAYFSEAKTIQSITLLHNTPGEGWSTCSEKSFNKSLYPLVVFYDGRQLNTEYNQALGDFGPGEHSLVLFGQKESVPFIGGSMLINFSDGYSLRLNVPARYFTEKDFPECPEAVAFDPGRVWLVQEGIWQGKWIRQENSMRFQASWEGLGQQIQDELTLESVNGYLVKIYRKGTNGYYYGILSCDKRHITDGVGDWFAGGDRWRGDIFQDNDDNRPSSAFLPEMQGL